MSDTYGPAHRAARELALHRWKSQVVTRAAQTVLERVTELDSGLRAELHQATADEGNTDE